LVMWESLQPQTTACAVRVPTIRALRARLEEPPKDVELPLVHPTEFVKLIQGKENYWGRSVMRTAWPMPEPTLPGGGIGRHPDVALRKKVSDGIPDMPIKATESAPTKLTIIPALLEQAGYVKKKEWVGLTEDDIKDILDCGRPDVVNIKKAAQKLKENNT